jgi:hypothetical protein
MPEVREKFSYFRILRDFEAKGTLSVNLAVEYQARLNLLSKIRLDEEQSHLSKCVEVQGMMQRHGDSSNSRIRPSPTTSKNAKELRKTTNDVHQF